MKPLQHFIFRWCPPLTAIAALVAATMYPPDAQADPYSSPTSTTQQVSRPDTKPLDSMPPTSAGDKQSGKAWELFTKLDKNHDNMLSKEEVQSLPAIADKFDSLDKGSKGYLNFEEFKAGLRDAPSLTK